MTNATESSKNKIVEETNLSSEIKESDQKSSKKDKKSSKKTKLKSSSKETDKLKKEIELLKKQLIEEKIKVESAQPSIDAAKTEALKYMAELENFKKRKQQEVDTFKKYAAESVVTAFLPVLDNFLLACSHAEKDVDKNDKAEVIKGFVLIKQQFDSALEKLDVKPIDALDKPFDPNKHQAIQQIEKDGVKPDIVVDELQKGYMLFERVIRPSMVVVSK